MSTSEPGSLPRIAGGRRSDRQDLDSLGGPPVAVRGRAESELHPPRSAVLLRSPGGFGLPIHHQNHEAPHVRQQHLPQRVVVQDVVHPHR